MQRVARLACAILSLPVPSKSVALSCEGETANTDSVHRKILHKFLLVGSVNSGACTIFKQVGFSLGELGFSSALCCIHMHACLVNWKSTCVHLMTVL